MIDKHIKHNIKEYDKKYFNRGYGIKYPEGHVIRHSKYFKKKKFNFRFWLWKWNAFKFFFSNENQNYLRCRYLKNS